MAELRLYWLGPPEVQLDSLPVRLEMRKTLALLAYLSLSPQPPTRETLTALFWPEYDQQHAFSNLRRNLSSLVKSLPPELLEIDRERVELRRDCVHVDVDQFHRLLAQANTHTHPPEQFCKDCLQVLEQAVEIYRGDFIEGFNLKDCPEFDDWQFFEREGLRAEYARALERLAGYYQETGEWENAIHHARTWLTLDRLHEPVHRVLMRLYFLSGQKSAALRQYEECERLLEQELGQPPEPDTLKLYEEIRNSVLPVVRQTQASFLPAESNGRPDIPLTKTKFFLPKVPRTIIHRPRLVSLLNRCVRFPLTLISASAGFGKTTLLAEWVAQSEDRVAWVSLDRSDNDEYLMVDYIIHAVRNALPESNAGTEALKMLHTSQPVQISTILSSLINDLIPIPNHLILVLDDYHTIDSLAAHDAINILLAHRPANLHLVISTRSDPPLSLARLRANYQLGDVRTDDLRFTEEEAQSFLTKVIGFPISTQDLSYLDTKVEGWIAGIQMAALAMQSNKFSQSSSELQGFFRAFKASQRYVLDYLIEEVLNHQPQVIRSFLMRTSILEKICCQLCDSLLEESVSDSFHPPDRSLLPERPANQEILEYLERSNLFLIPLDDERKWFRYHHLFADLLHVRLQQHEPKLESVLHKRAASWYSQNSYPVEAVEHALAAGDFSLTADIIEDYSLTLMGMNQIVITLDWFNSLPPEMVQSRPLLMIYQAYMLSRKGDFENVENLLVKVEKLLETRPDFPAINECRNIIIGIRTYLANLNGDAEKAVEVGLGILALTGDEHTTGNFLARFQLAFAYSSSGDLVSAEEIWKDILQRAQKGEDYYHSLMVENELAAIYILRGRLRQAEQLYTHMNDWINQNIQDPSALNGLIKVREASLLIEQNELEKAHQLIQEDVETTLGIWRTNFLPLGYTVLAYLHIAESDFLQARSAVENAIRQVQIQREYPRSISMVQACQVKLWLAEGNLTEAQKWADVELSYINKGIPFGKELDSISAARVLVASKRWEEALDLLQRLGQEAEAGERFGRLLSINILHALTLEGVGRHEEALDLLEKCLRFAHQEGFVRVFLDERAPMKDLIQKHKQAGKWRDQELAGYVDKLLSAFSL